MARPVVLLGRDYSLDQIFDAVAERLEAAGIRAIRPPAGKWSVADAEPLLPEIDVLVVASRTPVSAAQLDMATRLRGLTFASIGTEAVHLPDANERGLIVAHGPTPEGFTGIAEATVMLIAALMLELPRKERITRQNQPRPGPLDLTARLVSGSTIGLVGLGRIARGVVERLAGWNTRILAYDPYLTPDKVPAGVELVDYDTLLRESDVVSVHVSLTDETRFMVGARELGLMKKGSYLVNTARGGAVDDAALAAALESGHLAGAALDVFNHEPLRADEPLRRFDNVIMTSHMVGHTLQANQSLVPVAVENIQRILRGEDPKFIRNPEAKAAWRERLARLPALRLP